ncbi:hypothetical protein ABZ921_17300 [Streptomyces atriruber]|uniref:Uncharacterized protein n=1 Tax=Streptomyces atriruber TaxID=545121 RepID=A0ABV3BMZ7_9ACTN
MGTAPLLADLWTGVTGAVADGVVEAVGGAVAGVWCGRLCGAGPGVVAGGWLSGPGEGAGEGEGAGARPGVPWDALCTGVTGAPIGLRRGRSWPLAAGVGCVGAGPPVADLGAGFCGAGPEAGAGSGAGSLLADFCTGVMGAPIGERRGRFWALGAGVGVGPLVADL